MRAPKGPCARCSRVRPRPCRGLCRSCGDFLYRNDRDALLDYPTRYVPSVVVLEEWAILRREGYTARQAAERLGMTFAAFDQALVRARRVERARVDSTVERPLRCAS